MLKKKCNDVSAGKKKKKKLDNYDLCRHQCVKKYRQNVFWEFFRLKIMLFETTRQACY